VADFGLIQGFRRFMRLLWGVGKVGEKLSNLQKLGGGSWWPNMTGGGDRVEASAALAEQGVYACGLSW